MFDQSTPSAVAVPSSPEGPSNDTTAPGLAARAVDAEGAADAVEDPEEAPQLKGLLARINHQLAAVDLADLVAEARRVHEEIHGTIRGGRPGQGNSAPSAQFFRLMRSKCDLGRRKVEMLVNIASLAPETKEILSKSPLRRATKVLEQLSKLDHETQLAVAKEHGSRTAFVHKLAEMAGTQVPPKANASPISIIIPIDGQSRPVAFPSGHRVAAIRAISPIEVVIDLLPTNKKGVRAVPDDVQTMTTSPEVPEPESPASGSESEASSTPEPLEPSPEVIEPATAVSPINAEATLPEPEVEVTLPEEGTEANAPSSASTSRLGPDWSALQNAPKSSLSERDVAAIFLTKAASSFQQVELGPDTETAVHGVLANVLARIKGRKSPKKIHEAAGIEDLKLIESIDPAPAGTTVVYAAGNRMSGVFCMGYGRFSKKGKAPTKMLTTLVGADGSPISVLVPISPPLKDFYPLATWILNNAH